MGSSQTGSMSVQQADILTELSVQAVQQAGTYRKQQILAKTDPVPMDGGNGDCSGITCSAKAFCCPCCITGDVAAHVGSESCAMCCVSGCCIHGESRVLPRVHGWSRTSSSERHQVQPVRQRLLRLLAPLLRTRQGREIRRQDQSPSGREWRDICSPATEHGPLSLS